MITTKNLTVIITTFFIFITPIIRLLALIFFAVGFDNEIFYNKYEDIS